MRHLGNQGGFIKPLFWIFVVIAIGYSGIQFGMPYYRYQMLKADAKDFARSELGNIEKIKTKVHESAERLKVPIEKEHITVTTSKDIVRIRASWSETVDLLGLYQTRLRFDLNVEE